jgi:hypothetical protein
VATVLRNDVFIANTVHGATTTMDQTFEAKVADIKMPFHLKSMLYCPIDLTESLL